MKKIKLVIISIIFFLISLNVKAVAMSPDEVKKRNVCPNFELSLAIGGGQLQKVECYDTYDKVYNAFSKLNDKRAVILERKNNVTRFINAKLSLVYLGVRASSDNTIYYSDSTLKEDIAYINHNANYGATDGVFLDFNYSNHAIKVKTNGVTGWIKDGYYQLVPLGFQGNVSYYEVTNSELKHYYGGNILITYKQSSRTIDKKPSMLPVGKYYSYDGIYFYKDIETLVIDYKNNNFNNSVNKDNPYYNYYMYLPHRAKSNYSSDDIDAYLKNTRGLVGTIYGRQYVNGYSNMFGTGIFFKASEQLYGANAILMMSLATNESGLGQSSIARDKNNLFGHAAYDSSAYDSATGYLNPYQSIVGHANTYINCGYAKPTDWRYHGSNMGMKSSGMNVEYASDPFWGEKAANYYYQFDRDNGFLDYNYYQLGITNAAGVINTRLEPKNTGTIPYTLKSQGNPVIILEEVNGATINGSSKWYKIVSDANLNSARTSIMSCSTSNYYNWNAYVYVHSSYIKKINKTQNGKLNSNQSATSYKNYTYKEYSNGSKYAPKVGLITKDTNVYDTATLTTLSGKTIKKGNLTTVFMEAIDEKKNVVAYLVTTDYSKNQRRWISASSLSFSDKDILKVSLNNAGSYLNVYKEPGKTVLGAIYTDTYAVVIDRTTYNNNIWLKIYYGIDNTTAWINTNISASTGSLSYTTNKLNQPPVITATDTTVLIGTSFNPLSGVTAKDDEDGNVTSKIKVTKNTVNTSKLGTYEVTYEVVDSKGLKATKTIKVVVQNYKLANSLFIYESIKQVSNDIFEFKGFLGVKKEDNVSLTHEIIFEEETTKKTKTFKMNTYSDYPYDVHSLDDDKNYNYKAGWFKGNVDLSTLDDGSYKVYIVAYNLKTGNYTKTYFTNIAYQAMPRRVKGTKGYSFDIDYSYSGSPMIVSVRKQGLLSYDTPSTLDPMYNFFNELKITNDTLSITGTSHNVGVSYSKKDKVEREIIFENISTYQRYIYNLSYIDNGPYQVKLAVSDNKDKTRAWFKKTINISNLPKGTYAIYLKTTSNSKSYYGELVDVAYTDFSKINTNKYELKRVDSKRLRVELTVK